MEGKKILFISTKIYPIIGGDTIYSCGLIYRLSQTNNVTVLTFGNDIDFGNHPIFKKAKILGFKKTQGLSYKVLKLLFNKSLLQDYSFGIKKFLAKENLNKYDYIIFDHLRSFSIGKNIFNKDLGQTKVIYVAHNVESINQIQKLEALVKKRILIKLSDNVHDIEKKMIDSCDTIWTLNKKDLEIISKSHHVHNRVVKPYFPWERIKFKVKKSNNTNQLLFLGSLNWYPNIQGILHFVNDIFPEILKSNDSVKLNIVGQSPSSEILNLASDRIKIYSNVESVDPYILKCDLLLIPNRSGTGSKIKLLESIMKGLPLVTYRENIVGYENLDLAEPFVVDDANQFCESVLELLNDSSLGYDFIDKNLKLINDNAII